MNIIVALLASVLWLKGNTHTHTAMSDGDSSPEEVVAWYRAHGYDFLVLSDHDKITKVEDANGIILIDGEEVTDRLPKKPLHLIAINIKEVVPPQHGETPKDVLQNNVNAIRKAGGIAAINHPNFGWAFGSDVLKQIDGATMMEIASGHPYVNMQGPPSAEQMWDDVLTSGKRIWGIAVDDSHHLKRPWDVDIAPPGKAWIVVRSETRKAEAILDAIVRGDFYASTGVEIDDYVAEAKSIAVKVKEKNGAHYRVQFIGKTGRVLQETEGPIANYAVRGDEGYVRAKVLDSNGKFAWLQPMFICAKEGSPCA